MQKQTSMVDHMLMHTSEEPKIGSKAQSDMIAMWTIQQYQMSVQGDMVKECR